MPRLDSLSPNARSRGRLSERMDAEYQEALRMNAAAKRRYNEVAAQTVLNPQIVESRHGPTTILKQHLAMLQQQKQHAILVESKDQLEAIKATASLPVVNTQPLIDEDLTEKKLSQDESEALADSISSSVHALELAVVQAHHQAKNEKALLERARSALTDPNAVMGQHRSQAISAVRNELTAWLEQSLHRCQEVDSTLEEVGAVETEDNGIDWEAKVDDQYEQYLGARRRLLDVVASLRAPLPLEDSKAIDHEEPQKQSPRSPNAGMLTTIEKTLLPRMQYDTMLEAYSEFADEQLQKEVATTTNTIARLSDESQLLQAFPMLTHSGGFENALSTFGTKRHSNDVVTNDITKRLESWLFAAEAADVASTGTTEKYLQHGNEAMDTVLRSLCELQVLRETAP